MLELAEQEICAVAKSVGNGLVLRQAEGFYLDATNGGFSSSVQAAQVVVRLLSLGSPKRVFKSIGLAVDITAGNGLDVAINTGGNGPVYSYSAAQLQAYGVAFDTASVFNIAVANDSKVYINGVAIPSSSMVTANTIATVGGQPNFIGAVSGAAASDFVLLEIHVFNSQYFPPALALKKAYNAGRGANAAVVLRAYLAGAYNFLLTGVDPNTYRFFSVVGSGSVTAIKIGGLAQYQDATRLYLDGSDDYLEIENSANLAAITTEITITSIGQKDASKYRTVLFHNNVSASARDYTFGAFLNKQQTCFVLSWYYADGGQAPTMKDAAASDYPYYAGKSTFIGLTTKVNDSTLCKNYVKNVTDNSATQVFQMGTPARPVGQTGGLVKLGFYAPETVFTYMGWLGPQTFWNIALTAGEIEYIAGTDGGTKVPGSVPATTNSAYPRIYRANPNLLIYIDGTRAGAYDADCTNLGNAAGKIDLKNYVLGQPNLATFFATRRGASTTVPAP